MKKISVFLFLAMISMQMLSCVNAEAKKSEKTGAYEKYVVISGTNLSDFQSDVSYQLRYNDYSLVGGVSFDGKNYYQALAK